MNNRISFFLAITLLLGIVISGLAMWSETLRINATINTGEVDVEFVSWTYSDEGPDPQAPGFDNSEGKDVASTLIHVVERGAHGGAIKLSVMVENAYPGYTVDLSFIIRNTGTIPVKLLSFDITGINETAITVIYEEPEACIQLHPGDELPYNMSLTVKQEADELATYTFEVVLVFAQWNEVVCQPTLGSISGYFWIDSNEDGIIDETEAYYSGGALVELYDENDTLLASTYTNVGGYYIFTGLKAGTYKIKGYTPFGYYNTTPIVLTVILASGQNSVNNNFGINTITPPTLSAFKDFRHTNVNWSCNPMLGDLLDNNGTYYFVNVTLDKKSGKIDNIVPGVFYGVIVISGYGLNYLNITDIYENHFDIRTLGPKPDVRVVLYNGTTNCASDITNKATISVDNALNTASVILNFTQQGLPSLSFNDAIYVYMKFEKSSWLEQQYWNTVDKLFNNNAYIETNLGIAEVNAIVQLRLHPSS